MAIPTHTLNDYIALLEQRGLLSAGIGGPSPM